MSDSVARCAGWLALGRQAPSYVRYLRPWMAGVGFDVIASTLARLLARRGRNVLAADLDTNPGLAMSLGMPRTDAGLSAKAVEEHPGANYGWQLASGLTPPDAVARFSTRGPDGVHFLGVGKITSPNKSAAMQSVAAIVQILLGVGSPDWDVIADLEAGPTTPFERYHAFASDVMVVVGPAWRSAMTARRLLPMVADSNAIIVENRFRDEASALIRHLVRDGETVVALDADPNPNLGISLGVSRPTVESMKPILNALLDSGHTQNDPQPSAEELMARFGGGDGCRPRDRRRQPGHRPRRCHGPCSGTRPGGDGRGAGGCGRARG